MAKRKNGAKRTSDGLFMGEGYAAKTLINPEVSPGGELQRIGFCRHQGRRGVNFTIGDADVFVPLRDTVAEYDALVETSDRFGEIVEDGDAMNGEHEALAVRLLKFASEMIRLVPPEEWVQIN
jgi:hypothetical protein